MVKPLVTFPFNFYWGLVACFQQPSPPFFAMSGAFIKILPPEVKLWAARAVAGLIIADGVVSEAELAVLRESISFLDDLNQVNEIVELVKLKERPQLEVLKCERKLASNLLLALAMVAMTDDKLTGYETEYFTYIAGKLGFEPRFAHVVILWAKDFIKLTKKKKDIIAMGEKTPPMYLH